MSAQSKHILLLRFSAMGDVALLAPVVKSFLSAYPDHRVTVVSRPKFSAFFNASDSLKFFSADVDSTFAGLGGVIKLFFQLGRLKPTVIFDLHDHFRSRVICFLFRLGGKRIIRFKKGRSEKKLLTRKVNKFRKQLPHTVERYKEVFTRAGFAFPILQAPYIDINSADEKRIDKWLLTQGIIKYEMWIGLAPFAAHKTKIWPVENYLELIESSLKKFQSKFFLFGGENELSFFTQLSNRFPGNCVMVAGRLTLAEELALMKRLDKMICVDSSNMHLASLLGIQVISIWGGTHPSTGFGPFGNNNNMTIEVDPDRLPCRPCSVYGKDFCWRGDFACLKEISPTRVLESL